MRRFEYHRADTLEQASRLLTELGDDTFLFNGGTDLLVEIRERLRRVRHVVDIKQIPGMSDITYDETRGLSFGALVTVGRLERLPLVRKLYPNLRAALASLGSIQVRNRATVVGNVCRASPSADTIPPLIADGAFIHIYSRTNMRVVPRNLASAGGARRTVAPTAPRAMRISLQTPSSMARLTATPTVESSIALRRPCLR